MVAFNFSVPTQIQFGPNVSRQAGPLMKGLVGQRGKDMPADVLAIVDPGVRGLEWAGEILQTLEDAGLEYQLFEEVKPNPREEDVEKAASWLTAGSLGGVLAIGGGSTMDTAKAASLLAVHGGKIGDYAGWAKVPGPVLPVVAIPTTAGSGSEATCWAVITAAASHIKLAIGDPLLAPRVALVDPVLTASLPPAITAATGMDVLAHAVEAYIGCLSNPPGDALALEAIRLVAAYLLRAATDRQDAIAREGMMMAATLGGIAINNADVAGVHCLSEAIGSLYDAPHGVLNAALLPYFMAYWQDACGERFGHIAEAFGAGPRPEEAVARVTELRRALKIPSLAALGIKRSDLAGLAALAESNVSNASNPITMRAADYQAILERALEEQLQDVP